MTLAMGTDITSAVSGRGATQITELIKLQT